MIRFVIENHVGHWVVGMGSEHLEEFREFVTLAEVLRFVESEVRSDLAWDYHYGLTESMCHGR